MKKTYIIVILVVALLISMVVIMVPVVQLILQDEKRHGFEHTKAIDFKAELLDGSTFEFKDLKGKYVLLDFWGSWCGPCRRANKGVVELHDEFNGKIFQDADGFEIVSVAIENDEVPWKAAIEKDQLDWKHHIITYRSDEHRISKQYGIKSIPAPILIGPDGDIIGYKWSERKMRRYLKDKLQS